MAHSTSIVSELQQHASGSEIAISELLRKALIVASKLAVTDFEDWVQAELSGYYNRRVPEYRFVVGDLVAWSAAGHHQPIRFNDAELDELASKYPINSPVAEIERFSLAKSGLWVSLT